MMPFPAALFGQSAAVAGAMGDVLLASKGFATGTSTGNVDYTTASLNGKTPKAVLLAGGSYAAGGSGQTADTAGMCIGTVANTNRAAYLKAREWSFAIQSAALRASQGYYVLNAGSSGSVNKAANGSLIPDGLRLNWTINSTNWQASYLAFAGADVQAQNGDIDLGTGTSAISVACGFAPDVVIFYGVGFTSLDSGASNLGYIFGVKTAAAERCVIWRGQGSADPINVRQALLTDAVAGDLTTAGAVSYKLNASLTGTGFSVTPTASAGGHRIGYLALDLGGHNAKLVDISTPTSTGSRAITGVGFQPQALIAVLTNLAAANALPSSNDDSSSAFALSLIGGDNWTTGVRERGNVGDGDSATSVQNIAFMGPSGTDVEASKATLTSFDSGGWTENWSAVQGSSKVGFALAIE